MNSAPAPVSTASAASIIWSGVGEVKTWPGQAASSIPRPTKPACNGSCPEPPPEIRATLPDFKLRRRTNLRSGPSSRISACAAAKPSRLSSSTVSAPLISFFINALPICSLAVRINPSADGLGVARKLRRKIDDELFERAVLLVVAEVGHSHRDGARARFAMGCAQPTRMRASIRFQERRALGTGQMADFEDDRDMLGRNRHQIGRIGDLGHEGAVLAQGRRKFEPGAGRPVVEHSPQDDLVVSDIAVAGPADLFACIFRHEPALESTFAIAALSRATVTGATERRV